MMRKRTLITAAVVVLAAVLWIRHDRQNIRVEIDGEEVAYVVGYCRGGRPPETGLPGASGDDRGLVEMLNGEYAYRKTQSNYGSSGGGPYSILFYGADGQLIADIRYFDGLIAVPKNQRGKYRLYEKVDGRLSFQEFEAYLNTYGRNR